MSQDQVAVILAARKRYKRLLALRRRGKTIVEIAGVEGITHQRVSQLLRRAREQGFEK